VKNEEKKLLSAKNPKQYIEFSLSAQLTSGRKAHLCKQWLEKRNQYTIDDIKYARNRHPYWKKKKMEGCSERNAQRMVEYDFSQGFQRIKWTDDEIKEFITMNKKLKNGRYEFRDRELAEHFNCSIPAIQHLRRKYNMIQKIFIKKDDKLSKVKAVKHMGICEQNLKKMLKKR